MRVIILVDNKVSSNLKSEHGFSMLIESGDRKILLDTGQGGVLETNARALNVDLDKIDILVLSHGHYDHTGGIARMLREAPDLQIYCHPGVVEPRFAVSDGTSRAIHMDAVAMGALKSLPPPQLHYVTKPQTLAEGIELTGPIPRETAFEDTGGPFFLDPEGRRPDPLIDDLAVWFRTNEGVVILTGCCHSGVVNTVNHVRLLTGNTKIRALIGGFHLASASPERIEKTGAMLSSLDLDRVIACHCTGDAATAALKGSLGNRVIHGHAGMTLEF